MTARTRSTAVRIAALALALAVCVTGALASSLVLSANLEEAAHACCDIQPGAASCVTLCASSHQDAKLSAFPDLAAPSATAAPARLAQPPLDDSLLTAGPVDRAASSLYLEHSALRI